MAESRSDRRRMDRLGRRGLRRSRASLLGFAPRAEALEQRITLTADIWTGAASTLWSDGGNWQDGTAPTAGEDLIFPASATNKTSVYDSGLGVSSFGSIDIQDSGYDIATSFSSSLTLTSGLSATYNTSISNFDISFGPGNGVVSVAAGATLEVGGVISGTSGLDVTGGGTLQMAGNSSNVYSGGTTVETGTTLILDKAGASAIPGDLTINGGGIVQLAQSDQLSDVATVVASSGATLDLNNNNDTIGGLALTGATVTTGTGTLTLGGDITTYSDSNTSIISGNLDLGGATRTLTVDNNAQLDPDLSITANISGTGAGLIKAGANSQLKLSGNNTYDGTTTIAAGAIEIASDNALGASSAGTVVNSGFSLVLLGGITVPEPITINGVGFGGLGAVFNGSGDNTITGAITLGAASTLGSLGGNLTFSGAISDGASSFALTKVQSGTVTLTSANSYDGGTTINGGVLAISDGSALGTGAVSLSAGSELDLGGGISLPNDVNFNGGATIATDSAAVITGLLAGSSEMTKGGVGTLFLANSGNSTSFSGGIEVAGGTLSVAADGNLPAGDITLDAGTTLAITAATTVDNALTLTGDASVSSSAAVTLSGLLTGTATLTKAGVGTLTLANSGNSAALSGGMTIAGGTLSVDSDGNLPAGGVTLAAGTTLAITAATTVDNALTLTGDASVSNSAAVTLSGLLTGTARLTKLGSDTLTLTNTGNEASFTGPMTASNGTLSIADDDALVGGTVTFNGAFFKITGTTTIDNNFVLATAATPFLPQSGVVATLTGVISETGGSRALNVGSSGTLVLSGSNTYSGTTNLNGATVSVASDANLGSGTIRFNQGGTLLITGNTTIDNPVFLNVNGTVNTTADATFSGVIDGTKNLTKTGAASLTLSATETYTGATTVSAGTLVVDGSIAASSGLTVASGATIGGSGTLSATTVNSGGTISPGNSPGIISTGDLALTSGSTLVVQLDGTTAGPGYDQVSVAGTVDLGGATLSISTGFAPVLGDTFAIVDNDGSDAITGTFLGLAEGATITSGAYDFQISYVGGNGNDVTLTVVGVTYTWSGLGGDNNWSTAANWDTNVAPSGGEDLLFPMGAARLSNNNDLTGLSFHSIQIAGSGYSIFGNAITLTNGISSTYAAGLSTFGIDTTLTSTETFDVATGGTLDMSGVITGGYGVTKDGGGTLSYSGSSANLYNGTTTINAGTLLLAKSDGVISANGSVIVGDNTTSAMLQLAGSDQFWVGADVTINEGSTFEVGSHTAHISNLNLQGSTVQIDNGGVLATFVGVNTFDAANDLTSNIQGLGALQIDNSQNTFNIADDPGAAIDLRISTVLQGLNPSSGFYKQGSGTLALSVNNTFGGSVAVNAGAIQVESDNALGTTAGGTTVANGASVYFSGTFLGVSENFTDVAGFGIGGLNLFQVLSGDVILPGNVTMTGSIGVGAVDGSNLTFNGVIDDGGSTDDLNINNGSNGRTVLNGSNLFDGNVNVISGFARGNNDNSFGDPTSSSTIFVGSGTSLEIGGGIMIPSTKTIAISGLPVANSSKISSVSGDNTILGDIGITGGNNESFDVANGTTLTASGVISGSLDFDKNGLGTLVLTGTNTNTGNVNVGDGTLIVNGSLATSNSVFVDGVLGGSGTVASTTISNIGTLAPGNSPGVLNTGNLAFQSSGSTYSVELDGTAVGTQYDQANVTGTVTLAGATLSTSLGYTPAIGDTFTIINNDGSDPVNGTFNGLAEGSTITIGALSLTISYVGGDGNDVTLTASDVTYTWSGADVNGREWSRGGNWVGGVAPTPGSNLVFPSNPVLTESVNDFAGGTTFHSILIANTFYDIYGNAIDLSGGITTAIGGGSASFALDVELLGSQSIDVAAGDSLTFGGAISDGGHAYGVTKTGGGSLIFSIANTYTGTTSVEEGLLQLDAAGVSLSGDLTVGGTGLAATVQELQANQIADGAVVNLANAGATLDLNGLDDTIGSLSLTGSTVTTGVGTMTIASGGSITTNASSETATIGGNLAFGGPNNFFTVAQGTTASGVDLSVSAVVSSIFNIIKAGAGTMAFSGANTYSGGTNISSGVLALGNDTGAGTGVVNILGTGTLDLSGGITVANALNVYSSGVAILNSGGSNTISGSFNLGVDSTIDTAASTILVITSSLDDSGNSYSLTKTGAGSLQLDEANAYGGGTTVSAGILAITNSGSLGTGDVANDAEIVISNNLLLNNNFTINTAGTAFVVNGLTTIQGTVSLLSNLVIDTPGTANLYLNGVVSGSGFALSKSGTGTLGLGQANSYTGGTSILGGYLQVFNGQATGTSGTLTIDGGATLIQSAGTYTLPAGGLVLADSSTFLIPLASSDTLYGSISLTGNATFDIASGGTLEVSDEISGIGGFTKAGGGLLFLDAFSSYTGATIVSAGTLRVDGNISSSSLLTVADAAVLMGYGIVGEVSVASGGTLAPGASPEFMQTGNLSFGSGSNYSVDIDGPTVGSEYDQAIVTGTVALNGSTLLVIPGYAPIAGTSFTIINNDGSDAIEGTFAGLPEGSGFSMGGQSFAISYVGGDGNDVTLTAIGGSTTQVSSNSATSIYGDQLTFTALVTAGGGMPTGLVSFYDGSAIPTNLIGTGTLNNLGIAVFATSSLSASGSPHSILAVYAGTGLYAGSTSSAFSQSVSKATLTVTANNQSKVYGAAVPTLTASYSGFKNGQSLGTSGVTGSPALATTATSASHVTGSPYAISATNGTLAADNYDFSFVNGQLSVTPASLTISANNQSKKFGAPVPTLTVSYNGLVNGDTSASLTAQPTVSTSATANSPVSGNPYPITAGGAIASDYAISYVPGQLTVSQSATSTQLTAPSGSIPVGSYATFTARVSPVSPGAGTPSGMIAFHVNGVILATLPLVNGSAQFTISPIGAGTVQLMTAEYLGASNYQSSNSPGAIFSVVQSASSVGLTTEVNSAKTGVRLFASVPAAANGLIPTGTATFYSNGTAIRNVALVGGQASILVKKDAAIAKNFYVVYNGDANFLPSQSATIRVRKPDFSTTPAGPLNAFASKARVLSFSMDPATIVNKKHKAHASTR